MNLLQTHLNKTGMDEEMAMNYLQTIGAVSDNATTAAEVADCDAGKAIEKLEGMSK